MNWTLVTGGARRLGAEICRGLAEKGFPVLIHYHQHATEAAAVAETCRRLGSRAETVQGDFSTVASTQAFIKECQLRAFVIQNLVNNVGAYLTKSALETSIEELLSLYQSNLHAPFLLIKGFLPSIKQQRGSVVNLGLAGAALLQADLRRTVYRMAKSSLYLLTRALARELAPEQVRVNMVSPGYLENAVDLPDQMPAYSMGRPGQLKEVVRVILFLLDEENRYLTGQNIEVAGGVAL